MKQPLVSARSGETEIVRSEKCRAGREQRRKRSLNSRVSEAPRDVYLLNQVRDCGEPVTPRVRMAWMINVLDIPMDDLVLRSDATGNPCIWSRTGCDQGAVIRPAGEDGPGSAAITLSVLGESVRRQGRSLIPVSQKGKLRERLCPYRGTPYFLPLTIINLTRCLG